MKVRCLACREYVDKEEAHSRNGLSFVCSPECETELRFRPKKGSKNSINKTRADGPNREIPQATRKAVFKRDANRCQWCGGNRWLQLHHIIYRSQGGGHEAHNLITLCNEHHAMAHSDKGRYMPLLLGLIWRRYVDDKSCFLPQLLREFHDDASL